jgi:S-adenosylmethionine decarboxylase
MIGAGRGRGRGSVLESLGRHLLLELYDCSSEVLNSLESVKTAMVEAAKRAEATIIDVVFHEFNPFGISGVVVISESHLSIHTWPEHRYAAVDIFSCGDTLKPAEAATYLVGQFGASRASCVEVRRGVFPGTAGLANKAKEGVAPNGTPEPLQVVF